MQPNKFFKGLAIGKQRENERKKEREERETIWEIYILHWIKNVTSSNTSDDHMLIQ